MASSSKSSPPIGAIVGGAVGGVIAIVLIAILIVLLRRRQPRQPDGPRHETYAGEQAYETKQVDPPYSANNMASSHVPSASYDQRPYSPYGNLVRG